MRVNRPALKWYGGKWRLAPWIIAHLPEHTTYVEPFCGAASLFLRKSPSEFEVLNDLDENIVNFFRVLREQPDQLIYRIHNTPYSRQEYKQSWNEQPNNKVDRALGFYIRCWQGWGGGGRNQNPGWRFQHTNNRGKSVIKDWNDTSHLWGIAERLKDAFIEHDDALAIIERYDQEHTLFYLDPPYLPDTRWSKNSYQEEIDENYHQNLLAAAKSSTGMVIISGYPSELYETELTGWTRKQKRARTTNTANIGIETIWLSPNLTNRKNQLRLDL